MSARVGLMLRRLAGTAVAAAVAVSLVAAPAGPAFAQSLPGTAPDTTTGTVFDDATLAEDPAPPRWWIAPFGDLRLRGDFVTGLPAGREDLERARATLRAGLRVSPRPGLDADVSLRASLATDHNDDRRRNFDNEKPDAFELDLAAARVTPRPHWTISGGRIALPIHATALTWDDDLRVLGAAVAGLETWGIHSLRLAAAATRPQRYDDDESVLYTAQAEWRVNDAAALGAELSGTYWAVRGLEQDPAHQLQRQNSVVTSLEEPTRLAYEFGIVDFQLAAWAPLAGRGVTARLELARNLAVAERGHLFGGGRDRDDAWRARVAWGDTRGLGAVELGYVYQRVERDAVPGSFNSDDWWFHSADRGHSAWVAVGLGATAFVRVTGFDERRDDLSEHTRRLLVELTATLRAD